MKTTKGATYITSYKVFLKAQKQNVAEVTLQNNYVKSLTLDIFCTLLKDYPES